MLTFILSTVLLKLSSLNESLTAKQAARADYDTTIQETEAAYHKILESSQTLLHVLKREAINLVKVSSHVYVIDLVSVPIPVSMLMLVLIFYVDVDVAHAIYTY